MDSITIFLLVMAPVCKPGGVSDWFDKEKMSSVLIPTAVAPATLSFFSSIGLFTASAVSALQ
jgi:hypothetical protein